MFSLCSMDLARDINLFPHVKFDEIMDIRKLANNIKDEYFRRAREQDDPKLLEFANNITIYEDNSFYSELNEPDNVVMSWKGINKSRIDCISKTYTYTYILIHKDGKTYGSPLQNVEYIYDSTPYVRFCKNTCEEQFLILDEYMKSHEKAIMIGLFDIKNDIQRDDCISHYKEFQDKIKENKEKIIENERKIALLCLNDSEKRKNVKLVKDTKSLVKHSEYLTDFCYNIQDVLRRY
jgi:hypothetical protein